MKYSKIPSLADYNFNNAFALLHCLLRISAVEL